MANIDLNILPNEAINQKNDTTKHVAWARGDSTTRTFKIIDDAGAAVNVSGYTQIKMTVNSLFDPPDNSTQQFEIIGDLASGASGLVTFTPTTTQTNILADTYFYDIQAEDGSNVISTLIKSKVHIIQDISKTVSGVSTPDAGVITLLIGDSSDNGATNSIKVGDGGDLKIYHQGDQSYITETNNTGQLYIQGAHIWFQTPSGGDYLKLQNLGAVEAYWRGTSPGKRFETTQTGIDVTGTVTADSYIIDDGTYKTTIVENASSDITLTLPSSTGTLATLADVQAEDTLAEMNDVNLTSPSGGSFLQYDNASSKWIDTQTIVQHTDGIKIEGTSAGSSLFGPNDFGLAVDNNSGVGAIQVSGSELAYIDLQTPEGDNTATFDVRLIAGDSTHGVYPNAQLIAKDQNLDIKTTISGEVTLQRQGSVKLSTSANGIDVTGNISVTGNVDGQDVADIGSKATTAYGWGNHASAGYLTSFTETNDLSAAVTWANVPDANITQSSVTQHQAALSITKSQVSDFGTYATTAQGALADSALQSVPATITAAPTTVVTSNGTVPTVAVNKKYIDTYDGGVNAYILPSGTQGQMITFVNASTQNITLNRGDNSITLEKVIAGADPANVTDTTITVGKSGTVEVVYTGTDTAVVFGSGLS